MKRVALVTCTSNPKLDDSDRLLIQPFAQKKWNAIPAPWDDATIQWEYFDALIIRSAWNYHRTYKKFLTWLSHIETLSIPTFNSIALLRWNSDKSYLSTLSENGIVVPSMIWPNKNHYVMKPVVGSSGSGVQIVDANPNFFVQEFMQEVIDEGEYSFIYIGGVFSHAILKKPKRNEFRTNYRYGPTEIRVTPTRAMLKQTDKIISVVNMTPLYARIDGVLRDNTFILMELECIEPRLYFDYAPEAALIFVQAFLKSI